MKSWSNRLAPAVNPHSALTFHASERREKKKHDSARGCDGGFG
jgi:hypothetical protein